MTDRRTVWYKREIKIRTKIQYIIPGLEAHPLYYAVLLICVWFPFHKSDNALRNACKWWLLTPRRRFWRILECLLSFICEPLRGGTRPRQPSRTADLQVRAGCKSCLPKDITHMHTSTHLGYTRTYIDTHARKHKCAHTHTCTRKNTHR